MNSAIAGPYSPVTLRSSICATNPNITGEMSDAMLVNKLYDEIAAPNSSPDTLFYSIVLAKEL